MVWIAVINADHLGLDHLGPAHPVKLADAFDDFVKEFTAGPGHGKGKAIGPLPADVFAGAPAKAKSIGLRPEQIVQGEGEDSIVARVEHLGDQTRLHLSFKSHEIVTVTEAHTTLKSGDIVKIRPNNPFYFDAIGGRLA